MENENIFKETLGLSLESTRPSLFQKYKKIILISVTVLVLVLVIIIVIYVFILKPKEPTVLLPPNSVPLNPAHVDPKAIQNMFENIANNMNTLKHEQAIQHTKIDYLYTKLDKNSSTSEAQRMTDELNKIAKDDNTE